MKPLPLFAALSLVMALSMPTTSAQASNLSVREAIKQVGPQLRKLDVAGRVATTAMCFATACVINFAAPAEAAAANYLSSDVELLHSGDVSSIFAENNRVVEKSANAQPKLTFGHWLAKGVYYNSGDNLGVLRFGITAKRGSFTAFLTTAYRYGLDNNGIDDIPVKTRTRSGLKGTLIDNGEDQISYGYTATKLSTSKHLRVRSIQNYLLSYRSGPLHIASLGYEYVDPKKLSGDEGADNVRSHGAALYRVGIKYPLTASDAMAIDLKLNSVLHLGDIGLIKLGETWQGELNAWAGDDADLHHKLYHRGGGSIKVELADGRVKLSFGGEIHHTIGGNITLSDADGDFDLSYTILLVAGVFDIIPSQDISLSASFGRYDQSVNAKLGSETYENDSWGTSGRFLMQKKF